jgi:HEAT repeat protein
MRAFWSALATSFALLLLVRPAVANDCCSSLETCLRLMTQVSDPDPNFDPRPYPAEPYWCAGNKVSTFGPTAIPKLLPLLEHSDSRVRDSAAIALEGMGKDAVSALPALIKACDADPPGFSCKALVATDDVRAIPVLIRHIDHVWYKSLAAFGARAMPESISALREGPADEIKLGQLELAIGEIKDKRPEHIDQLRQVLRSELEKPQLTYLNATGCPRAPTDDCGLDQRRCRSRAIFIARAIESFGPSAVAAAPELRELAKRDDPGARNAAVRALIALKDVEAVTYLLRWLRSDLAFCRGSAIWGLRTLGKLPDYALPPLRKAARVGDWVQREEAATALGIVGDRGAVDVLRDGLGAPIHHLQAAAIEALGRLKTSARSAVPQLESLAQRHWSPAVRRKAARAVFAISGKTVDPKPGRCEIGNRALRTISEVTFQGKTLKLERLYLTAHPSKVPVECSAYQTQDLTDAIQVGNTCVLGLNRGEFGGSVVAAENGQKTQLREESPTNPIRFVEMNGEYLLFGGLGGTSSLGELSRIVRLRDGTLSVQVIAELPGEPVAFAFVDRSRLVVVAKSEEWDDVCPRDQWGLAERKPRPFIVSLNGAIEPVE